MSENLKIIKMSDHSEIDSIIDELKENYSECYFFVIDKSQVSVLFQGLKKINIESFTYTHSNNAWNYRINENHDKFNSEIMIELYPENIFLDESYTENRSTYHNLDASSVLILGNKDDIEACYKRQYAKFRNRPDLKG